MFSKNFLNEERFCVDAFGREPRFAIPMILFASATAGRNLFLISLGSSGTRPSLML
jgi:hypothetical protein